VREQQPIAADGSAKLQIREYKESLIINAAADLFYERGFQRTTLDDVAAVLGVTKPFIYTYFKSKHNVLERLVDKVYEDLDLTVSAFQKLEERDPVRRFEHFVSRYIRWTLELRTFTGILLEEEKNLSAQKIADIRSKQHTFDKLLADLVRDGMRAGAFVVDDAALASLAISGMVRWTHRWYVPNGRLSADDLCGELTRTALHMVGWTSESREAHHDADSRRPAGRRT
jgi:AcrR family transcriptional regulator